MKEAVILEESGKCSWGKCIFCSFSKKDSFEEPNARRLAERLDRTLDARPDVLKYFNSGSFLDEKQIPREFREYLIKRCAERGIKELIIECRAEYITGESIAEIKAIKKKHAPDVKITFALGLEAADDDILKKICKGSAVKDYVRAAELLNENGLGVRTYLMANLPFVKDIKKSLAESVEFADKYSTTIAIINTFPRAPAPLFNLWLNGSWKPLDRHDFDALTKPFAKNKKIDLYFDDYVSYPHFSNKESLVGANEGNMTHPHYEVWQDYIVRFYEPPKTKKYALFLPCSARKPYSTSKTHREIIRRLLSIPSYENIHQIMISNPGVIPREFEGKYPFADYDWPEWEETPEIKKRYIEVTSKRIEKYLAAHKYEKVFGYFKPGAESLEAVRRACAKLHVRFTYCADEKIYNSLENKDGAVYDRRMLDSLVKALRQNLK